MSKQKRLEHRYGWIEASLRYAGRFDKESYGNFFNINPPQISADQAGFVQAINHELSWREKQQSHVQADAGRPYLDIQKGKICILRALPEKTVFDVMAARAWLATLSTIPFIATSEIGSVEPSPQILQAVCDAIIKKKPLKIREVTGVAQPNSTNISAHSIFDNSGRLFLRVFDHGLGNFRNIQINRILDTAKNDRGVKYMHADEDHDWSTNAKITLEANPSAGVERARLAISDFGLCQKGLAREVEVPRALADFLVKDISCGLEGIMESAAPIRVREG